MIKPSQYRELFQSPTGREVFADLARIVRAMPSEHSGSAGQLIAHIVFWQTQADPPDPDKAREPRPAMKNGGRIEHGT